MLVLINLMILVLPLGSIAALRIYETELVRRTESELLAQGTVINLVYRDLLVKSLGDRLPLYGRPASTTIPAQAPDPDGRFNPLLPRLDVARESLRPPVEEARSPHAIPAAEAVAAGETIMPLLKEAQRATLAGIRIVDPDGTVVASTGAEVGLSLREREEVERAMRGESVSLLYRRTDPDEDQAFGPLSRRTRYRVHVALSVTYAGRVLGAVVLMRTPLDVRKALYYHREPLTYGALFLVGLVLVVAVLTSLTISQPIARLMGRIERMGQAEKGPAAGPGPWATREVDRLTRAFDDMTEKLDQRSEYIRAFVSNVSHAFKTPLASTRAAVELLKDHLDEMTPEERLRFLDIIEADAGRLDRLVTRLTDLARADVVRFRGESASVPELLNELRERYAGYGLDVSVESGPGPVRAAMDRDTLESILSNLLDNARKHGGPGIRVKVELAPPSEGRVIIRVSDNGQGISEGNATRIFRPFFTTAQESGGSGLGLSIVQSLLKAHGGAIELEQGGQGASFRVDLPAA